MFKNEPQIGENGKEKSKNKRLAGPDTTSKSVYTIQN
jgi:hypothetical protein